MYLLTTSIDAGNNYQTPNRYCYMHRSSKHTCDLASIEFKHWPVEAFQNLIVLSLVPPPVARRFDCHGHHAKAFCTNKGKERSKNRRESHHMINAGQQSIHFEATNFNSGLVTLQQLDWLGGIAGIPDGHKVVIATAGKVPSICSPLQPTDLQLV